MIRSWFVIFLFQWTSFAHGEELSLVAKLDGHSTRINSLRFVDHDRFLLSSDSKRNVSLWDLRSKNRMVAIEGHRSELDPIAPVVALESKFVFYVSEKGRVEAFDFDGRSLVSQKFEEVFFFKTFLASALTRDERFVAFVNNPDDRLTVMSTESWRTPFTIRVENAAEYKSMQFDDVGDRLYIADSFVIGVYSMSQRALVKQLRIEDMYWVKKPEEKIWGVDSTWFSDDGRFAIMSVWLGPNVKPAPGESVLSTSGSGIAVVDLKTEKLIYTASGMGRLLAGRMSQDQTTFAIAHTLRGVTTIELHDLVAGQRKTLIRTVGLVRWMGSTMFESNPLPPVALSEDLSLIAIPADNERQIYIYRLPNTPE